MKSVSLIVAVLLAVAVVNVNGTWNMNIRLDMQLASRLMKIYV